MDSNKVYESNVDLQEKELEESMSDSSVTDSFSEDEIDYSPPGFDTKTVLEAPDKEQPHGLSSKDHRIESWITGVTEDACYNSRTVLFNLLKNDMDGKTDIFIGNIRKAKQLRNGFMVYLTSSLSKTLGIKHELAQGIVLVDALILSPNFPVTVLTLTDDATRVDQDIRRHNTYCASWLTEILRDVDGSLSVLHGIVDVHDDLTETLDILRQEQLCFAFSDSLTMTPDRCKINLQYLLRVFASKGVNVCKSSTENRATEYVRKEQVTIIESDGQRAVKSAGTPTMSVNTNEGLFMNTTLDDVLPTWNEKVEKGIQSLVPIFCVIMQFAVYCNQWFDFCKAVQGSSEFKEQMSIPILYMLMEVIQLYRQSYYKPCLYLIIGLLMSRTGDILIVKKHPYSHVGLCLFSVSNMLYTIAFGMRLDKPVSFGVFAVLGTLIFNHFMRNIDDVMTLCFLAGHTVSVCVMSWRVVADVDSTSTSTNWKVLGIIGSVSSIANNIFIGIEVSKNSFLGSHVLLMATYLIAQFSITVSLLMKFDIIQVPKHIKTASIRFFIISVMSITMHAVFK